MSIGRRTLTLSTAFPRICTISLLANFLIPGVKANCWYNSDGVRVCNGLSKATGIVIGVVIFVILVIFFFSSSVYCRRRHERQAYLARVQQTRRGGGAAYRGPYGPGGAPPPFSPQYPPPAHSGLDSPYNYDPTAGFAPSSAPPPQYYPPPPGAPPVTSQK